MITHSPWVSPFLDCGEATGPALEIDGPQLRASIFDDMDAPIVTAAEQGAGRNDVVPGEYGDPRIDLISTSEACPLFPRRQDVDQHIDPLLLTPSVNILVNAAGSIRRTRRKRARTAPMLDHNVRTGSNFNRVDTEHVGQDFEVARIELRHHRKRHGPGLHP
jgi:hypothetical protein